VAGRLDRDAYVLELDERFTSKRLDASRWVPHYLPHWTTAERSAARFDMGNGLLRLRIDLDQPEWREADGGMRVSNLQTGTWSGPLGSARGQHRHVEGLTVVSPQPDRPLYTPLAGLVEVEMRTTVDPTTLLAFWLIGFEKDSPDDSGEICVVELFGDSVGTETSELSIGVKAHHDPRLRDDMARVTMPLDATAWHTYSAEWDAGRVRFYVDDDLVRSVDQGVAYPMQLMVDLFEFRSAATEGPYPKSGDVRAVRGYRSRS
jgi:hypothetical protein